MSARHAVLSNADISRLILSQATRPVRLLQTSRTIRSSEPCAELYEIWSHSGCPQHPVGAELECVNGLGGVDSAFCQGVFELDEDGLHSAGVSATSIARRIIKLLQSPPNAGTLVVLFGMGPTTVKLQMEARSRPIIVVTQDGWRKKGSTCSCTRQQAAQLLTELLTRTGSATLPCPDGSSAGRSVNVTRKLHVTVRLINTHATDTVLLSARRT